MAPDQACGTQMRVRGGRLPTAQPPAPPVGRQTGARVVGLDDPTRPSLSFTCLAGPRRKLASAAGESGQAIKCGWGAGTRMHAGSVTASCPQPPNLCLCIAPMPAFADALGASRTMDAQEGQRQLLHLTSTRGERRR